MDKGAHFYRCDLQVHTPRDRQWTGAGAHSDSERRAYAKEFIVACRAKGLDAVAITDTGEEIRLAIPEPTVKTSIIF